MRIYFILVYCWEPFLVMSTFINSFKLKLFENKLIKQQYTFVTQFFFCLVVTFSVFRNVLWMGVGGTNKKLKLYT